MLLCSSKEGVTGACLHIIIAGFKLHKNLKLHIFVHHCKSYSFFSKSTSAVVEKLAGQKNAVTL